MGYQPVAVHEPTMKFSAVAVLIASAGATQLRTAPDVAARVAEESRENLQIHDGFQSQEDKDVQKEKQVKADKDLSALQTHMKVGSWLTALDHDMKTTMLVQVGGIKD